MANSYQPDKYPVIYDESEAQLYYQKNGVQQINIGSAGTSLILTDSNGVQWNVTITTAGALVTTQI